MLRKARGERNGFQKSPGPVSAGRAEKPRAVEIYIYIYVFERNLGRIRVSHPPPTQGFGGRFERNGIERER